MRCRELVPIFAHVIKGGKFALTLTAFALGLAMTGCSYNSQSDSHIDNLNDTAYFYHYRNLDSVNSFAHRALTLSGGKGDAAAEATNHLAFVCMARMQYNKAQALLESVDDMTASQIELLVADVQMMRLCQRESRNKDFYTYLDLAQRRLTRFDKEKYELTPHQSRRLLYAQTEYHIVASTYYYYVGLQELSAQAMSSINIGDGLEQDTAQLINYYYNIGAGGIITKGTNRDIGQTEFDYLMHCYMLAVQRGYVYWQAQALQAISEHLQKASTRNVLIKDNLPAMKFLNTDNMPDSLLAGNLALRALKLFSDYGDIYQVSGAYRTLAECYWYVHDYRSALICLQRALYDHREISQAPDLVASIRERLCLVYSAADDKVSSDKNRNIYLDIQEQTRQDRLLEARADQLRTSSKQLNLMLLAVALMIMVVIVLLVVFDYKRRRSDSRFSIEKLLKPLRQWQRDNEILYEEEQGELNELLEQLTVASMHLQQNKQRNLEQRAKVQLVNSVLPLIERMANEVRRMQRTDVDESLKQIQYEYLKELTDCINEQNSVLTKWIQMRQGEVSLKIESFPLQQLFDIVERGRMSFSMKGITLFVKPTVATVRADRTLTLFMINTIADNARKFTAPGGKVVVEAVDTEQYVEIEISDNGCGMEQEQLAHLFDRSYTGGHGFGLKNCKGIIEKYKKTSRIFSICNLVAQSKQGVGTKISFRLPHGILRGVVAVLLGFSSLCVAYCQESKAKVFADSAYFSNIRGHYQRALDFADSCHRYLLPNDTTTLLDVSNEAAVAALALHKWDVYERNNKLYVNLFRLYSADSKLPMYVSSMRRGETNKTIAVILLLLLLMSIFPAYYILYYRHRLDYQYCMERIQAINQLLSADMPIERKQQEVNKLADFTKFNLPPQMLSKVNKLVNTIKEVLEHTAELRRKQAEETEFAGDDLKRLNLESARLHVSNSVLDNCLSALKHETMYYPSRIRQLLDEKGSLKAISEVVDYYHDLYVMLAQQADRQIVSLKPDAETINYLLFLLKRCNQNQMPSLSRSAEHNGCAVVTASMTYCKYTGQQCATLFSSGSPDFDFLLCRQIVREIGEATGKRACGIEARLGDNGIDIVMTLPNHYLSYIFKHHE